MSFSPAASTATRPPEPPRVRDGDDVASADAIEAVSTQLQALSAGAGGACSGGDSSSSVSWACSSVERAVALALHDASRSFASHARAARKLAEAHASDPQAFAQALLTQLNRCMLVYRREPSVERVVSFVAGYAASCAAAAAAAGSSANDSDDDDGGGEQTFCSFLLTYLLEFSNAKDKSVRFRACQLIASVLNALGEDAEIRDDLWQEIHGALVPRTRDRVPAVRAQAVAALCRLQDPEAGAGDPVISAYAHLMRCDTSALVRRAALSHAAIIPGLPTVEAAMSRTRDVREDVRKFAYGGVLAAKIDPRQLSIAKRVELIQSGTQDRSAAVRRACAAKMMHDGWLHGACDGDLVQLLRMLDVEENEAAVMRAAEAMLVEAGEQQQQRQGDDAAANEAVDVNELTPESAMAMYVRARALSIRAKKLRRSKDGRAAAAALAEQLDVMLPSVPDFCAALEYYHRNQVSVTMSASITEAQDAVNASVAFVVRMLLRTAAMLDLSDEGGRRMLASTVSAMLDSDRLQAECVEPAVRVLQHAMPSGVRDGARDARADDVAAAAQGESGGELVRVLVEKATELMTREEADEDMTAAASAAAALWRRERALSLLESLLLASQPHRASRGALTLESSPMLAGVLSTVIVPNLTCNATALRLAAVRCLGLYCLHDPSGRTALTHAPVLLQVCANDAEPLKLAAARSLFDMLCLFDMVGRAGESEAGDSSLRRTVLDALFGYLLEPPSDQVRTAAVEGYAKLLFLRRIEPEPELLKRLLLLYFTPSTEEDALLRQCLSVFFPAFAFSGGGVANRLALEQCMLPLLRVLVEAPRSSPLSAVNAVQVAQYVLFLTHPANAEAAASKMRQGHRGGGGAAGGGASQQQQHGQRQRGRGSVYELAHERIAVSLLNEVLLNPRTEAARVFCKLIGALRFELKRGENEDMLCTLARLTESALAEVKSAPASKDLKRFSARIGALVEQVERERGDAVRAAEASRERSDERGGASSRAGVDDGERGAGDADERGEVRRGCGEEEEDEEMRNVLSSSGSATATEAAREAVPDGGPLFSPVRTRSRPR